MKKNNEKNGEKMLYKINEKNICENPEEDFQNVNDTRIEIYLEELKAYAWTSALKYRFDPIIGGIHEEYLRLIKKVCKTDFS